MKTRNIILGIIFTTALIAVQVMFGNKFDDNRMFVVQIITFILLGLALLCFMPKRLLSFSDNVVPSQKQKLTKKTIFAAIMILITIPLTIYMGMYYLDDRKYYFISLMILLQAMLPFAFIFEGKKPQSREIVLISVLCAIAVAGRAAFYMIPQFKPFAAIVIISGVCLGGEVGFIVGALSAFVSNFFFGQGAWTPWQMFSFGIIGFLAGILFRKGLLHKTKLSLCIFGGIVTYVIYGGIMNASSLLQWQENPTAEMFVSYYMSGLPFDAIHVLSTVFFLWFISAPMIEKIDRVKEKYGLIE